MEIKTNWEISQGLYYTDKDKNKKWVNVDDIIEWVKTGKDINYLLNELYKE